MMQELNTLSLADRELQQIRSELRNAARAFTELARLLVDDDPGAIVTYCDGETTSPRGPLLSRGENYPSHWPERKDILALVARHLAATKAFESARCRLPADAVHILDVRDAV